MWCEVSQSHYVHTLDAGIVDGKKVYYVEKRAIVIGYLPGSIMQTNTFATIKAAKSFLNT